MRLRQIKALGTLDIWEAIDTHTDWFFQGFSLSAYHRNTKPDEGNVGRELAGPKIPEKTKSNALHVNIPNVIRPKWEEWRPVSSV